MHQCVRICAVLTRATRSPKFSRGRCFLQASIQRGETFTVLVFQDTKQAVLIATACPAAHAVTCAVFSFLEKKKKSVNSPDAPPKKSFTKNQK